MKNAKEATGQAKNQVGSKWEGPKSLEYFSEMIKHNEFNTMEENFYNLNAMLIPFLEGFREVDSDLGSKSGNLIIKNSYDLTRGILNAWEKLSSSFYHINELNECICGDIDQTDEKTPTGERTEEKQIDGTSVKSKPLINSEENKELAHRFIGIQNRLSENNNELFAIRGYIQLMKCYFQDEHFQEQSGFSEEHYFGIIDLSRKMLDTLDSVMDELCNCNDSIGNLETKLNEVN